MVLKIANVNIFRLLMLKMLNNIILLYLNRLRRQFLQNDFSTSYQFSSNSLFFFAKKSYCISALI